MIVSRHNPDEGYEGYKVGVLECAQVVLKALREARHFASMMNDPDETIAILDHVETELNTYQFEDE